MTDFSVRLQGVATDTSKVFAIAGSVYSEKGLILYAKWYGIFGALALCSILLVSIATWLDFPIRKLYVDYILKDKKCKLFLERSRLTPVYRFNRSSSLHLYTELPGTIKETKPTLNPCRRMCMQHSYLQALMRFDPRLSRAFRTLFLIAMQLHSIFVTALLYGFSFGSTKTLSASETILLSLITSLVTVPCIRLALYYLNRVGLEEFRYQFPMLYDEYMRRVEFEEIARPLFSGNAGGEEAAVTMTGDELDEQAEESLFLRILGWITPRKAVEEETQVVDRPAVLKKLAACVQKEYPKFPTYSILWDILPCHTSHGWLFLLACFGWIGWCLQYLLLFAASHSSSVGDGILISYASSELISIFITQPLSIFFTTAIFILSHKHKDTLPWPLSLIGSVTTKHSIPSMYYFSNPLNHHTYTVLSSEFAHTLFLDAPAKVSGVDILSTAPIKSILSTLNEKEEVPDRRIEDLYASMVKYYTRLQG